MCLGAVGTGIAGWGAYSVVTWCRYGHVDLARRPRDDLLDRFVPDPEVDEYHHIEVHAPASVVYDVATTLDLQSAPVIKQIFWLRELPSALRGHRAAPRPERPFLDELLEAGYSKLAGIPDREIVIGTYTQPWYGEVTFNPLPSDEFSAFHKPGYVKIAVTFAAEPLDGDRSRFVTRTRVVCTDAEARRKFRLYWAPFSAGIILIRYTILSMVKHEAERRQRPARKSSPTVSQN